MVYLPYLSALLTFLSVWLAIRARVSSWWVGIGAVLLATVPLVALHLWGQCLLQIIYLITNVYGWWAWHRGQQAEGGGIKWAAWKDGGLYITMAAASYMAFIWLNAHWPPLALTAPDATLTAASLAAQVALAQKRVEVWCLWIAIDLWSAWWFYSLGEPGFVLMFGGLAALAIYALYQWHILAKQNALPAVK